MANIFTLIFRPFLSSLIKGKYFCEIFEVCSDTPVLYSLVYGNWLAAPPSGLVAMYLALYNKVSL